MNLKEYILSVPDFPQPGVLFRDVSPMLKNPKALGFIADQFLSQFPIEKVDYFVGIESRGFILASLLAAKANKGFIPFRKAGKLPPPVLSQSYSLEYGKATLEAQEGTGNVIILDDVLATGGTLIASIELAKKAGYTVLDVGVLINLTFLNDYKFNNKKVFSLIEY